MRYKRLQSLHSNRNDFFTPFDKALEKFGWNRYQALLPYILEQDIPTLQAHIADGKFTYEELTLFYLFRIRYYETNKDTYLNAIIALNPKVLEEARQKDKNRPEILSHPLYGMPILLKDNISTVEMPTTAGAAALQHNQTEKDAFVVKQLKARGALILGKLNLSEWAYYFCEGCPLGYSAIGGQTLNPYGRKQFESGGSSSGSGVAMAANYAVASLGSETSGSILSPAGKNSVVGLKPTIGAVSRSGIVPISATLDTSGPMTRNVVDNAIVLSAMVGNDTEDSYSYEAEAIRFSHLDSVGLQGRRLGVIRSFLEDSLLMKAVSDLRHAGAEIIELDLPEISLEGFGKLLDTDMKRDLPEYLRQYAHPSVPVTNIEDVIAFNKQDTLLHAPYGQGIFEEIIADTLTAKGFARKRKQLMKIGRDYFSKPMEAHNLDAVVSINNYSASYAALAHFPALGVPMGFSAEGEPKNITFIAPSGAEQLLLEIGAAYERATNHRTLPTLFSE